MPQDRSDEAPEDTSDLDALLKDTFGPARDPLDPSPRPSEPSRSYPKSREWPVICVVVVVTALVIGPRIYDTIKSRRAQAAYHALRAALEQCKSDCAEHRAGYAWAEKNEIFSFDECVHGSATFVNGCKLYVLDQIAEDPSLLDDDYRGQWAPEGGG